MFRKTMLVIGATGKTGRRVAERLKARNLPVRLGSRSGQPPFDSAGPAAWPFAVRDIAAVYMTYYPDLAAPGASAGSVGEPFIHTGDIADAAIAAITEDRRVGQLHELTGPRPWTFAKAIAETARPDGRNASVADGVTRAPGRPPRDFTGYVRETGATGVWRAGAQL